MGRVRRVLEAGERVARAGGVERTLGREIVRLEPTEGVLKRGPIDRLELDDLDEDPKVDLDREVDRTAGLRLLVVDRGLMAGRVDREEEVRLWLKAPDETRPLSEDPVRLRLLQAELLLGLVELSRLLEV